MTKLYQITKDCYIDPNQVGHIDSDNVATVRVYLKHSGNEIWVTDGRTVEEVAKKINELRNYD